MKKSNREKDKENISKSLDATAKGRVSEVPGEGLPPYPQFVASLQQRIKVQRIAMGSIIGLLIGALVYMHFEKEKALAQAAKKEFFLVPSTLPNVLRTRANILDDSQVYEFAEWFTNELANVNYDNAEARYKTLEKYMTPVLRSSFRRQSKPKLELWEARQIDQEYIFDNIDKFERKTKEITVLDEDGKPKKIERTVYVTSVWGTVRKYIEGRESKPYKERIKLEFITGPITGDKTWLFEVTDIARDTREELEKDKLLK